MPKCYLHGSTAEKTETTNKPLPEIPFHDKNDFQQNLSLILAPKTELPHLKTYRWYDFQVLREENENIKSQFESKDNTISDLETKLTKKGEELKKAQDEIKEKDKKLLEVQTNILQKENTIRDLEAERTKNLEEITKKDDRIVQLQKLFLGGSKVLEKQFNHILQIKKDLEKESKEKGISQEKAKHLQEDIARYDENEKELNEKIKELEGLDAESRKLRDKELQELKEKLTKSNQALFDIQKFDQLVSDVLEPESQAKGLFLKSQEVIQKIKDLRVEKDNIQQQLNKELTWWDKWMNDERTLLEVKEFPKTIISDSNPIGKYILKSFNPSNYQEKYQLWVNGLVPFFGIATNKYDFAYFPLKLGLEDFFEKHKNKEVNKNREGVKNLIDFYKSLYA